MNIASPPTPALGVTMLTNPLAAASSVSRCLVSFMPSTPYMDWKVQPSTKNQQVCTMIASPRKPTSLTGFHHSRAAPTRAVKLKKRRARTVP